ncbi:MAG: RNA polymerase sigma-70 factor (ECF subfamily) [Candidatus Paceibacteria bacterium]|jgi:RNA polymerase sigma-70 factor (ECF subfamily)
MVQASSPNGADPFSADRLLRDSIVGGDRGASESFFRRELESLYEFVYYRVGRSEHKAEDLVQETFVTAFERLERYDGRSTLHTWLCGIARNKIREQRRKRQPKPIADVLAESDADIDAILANLEQEPLPDWVMEEKETAELVGATLSSLPPDYRDALVSKYVDGMTAAEIGEQQGKSEKAVESKLHRARLAFSRVFQLIASNRGEVA